METLHKLAESFNLFTAENIPVLYQESFKSYRKSNEIPLKSFDIFYKCTWDTNYKGEITHYYIDQQYCLTEYKGYLMMLCTNTKGQNYLHTYYGHENKLNFNYQIKNDILKHIEKPNYMGVITDKKLNDWLSYCYNCISSLQAKYEAIQVVNKTNIETVENFIKETGCKVQKNNTGNEFWLTTNLFEVQFTLQLNSGYIDKKIRFNGTIQDIINISKL